MLLRDTSGRPVPSLTNEHFEHYTSVTCGSSLGTPSENAPSALAQSRPPNYGVGDERKRHAVGVGEPVVGSPDRLARDDSVRAPHHRQPCVPDEASEDVLLLQARGRQGS